jgi:acetyltransferase-like isoleucine patch superfamily enzyme
MNFFRRTYWKFKGLQIGLGSNIQKGLLVTGNIKGISLGKNVFIGRNVELKIRDNSQIIIDDDVKIDDGVRIISANNSVVKIGKKSKIMFYSIINGGANITIGDKSAVAAFSMINSSLHLQLKNEDYMDQGHAHDPITIGRDILVGSHSSILPGSIVGDGCIISTHSVVQGETGEYNVLAGIPARAVKRRD